MTTKIHATKPGERHVPVPDDLKLAYQVHTLVQMLTMRLATVVPMVPAPYPPILH